MTLNITSSFLRSTTFAIVAIAASLAVFQGCSSELSESSEDESFTYSYSVNGCKTGKQTFSSKKQYCAGLLNEELNNGCAYDIRMETHERACK